MTKQGQNLDATGGSRFIPLMPSLCLIVLEVMGTHVSPRFSLASAAFDNILGRPMELPPADINPVGLFCLLHLSRILDVSPGPPPIAMSGGEAETEHLSEPRLARFTG